nr:restriction endonuclease subunit S [Psittacicella melopsittaci]
MEWGEYQLSDLFTIENTASFNKEHLSEGEDFDYVTRTSLKQGVLQTTGQLKGKAPNASKVWSLGLLQMDFFYRSRPWYAGQFVRKVVPKFKPTPRNIPFFTSLLNKVKPLLLNVLIRDVNHTFLKQKVRLPSKNGQVDFALLEKLATQLEKENLKNIQAYLQENGLDTPQLTPAQARALADFKNLTWQEYQIGELFAKLPCPRAPKQNLRKSPSPEFNTPVVYCKFGDNGIMYWGRENEFTTYSKVIAIISNGAIATGKVYAQKQTTGILSDSYFIQWKNGEVSHRVNLFLSLCLEKGLYHKYSRDNLATWTNKVEKDKVLLPTKNGVVDLTFMENFIVALEKQLLKDLGQYLQKRKKAT